MTILYNEITVNASPDKVWALLTDLERLDQYDPTVKKSTLLSDERSEVGAKRKVLMKDGKNWLDERITVFKPNEALTYQLTDCSFPIKGLRHSYTFEKLGEQIKVKQVMEYTVKMGILGRLMDHLMIRKQFNNGIKQFFDGFKSYIETH
jgi:ribosome-associated toxin RatA of RatAB toxin-antitoxin module